MFETKVQNTRYPVMIVDKHPRDTHQRPLASPLPSSKPIIFPTILAKGSMLAGPETPTWNSASPRRRRDGVDPPIVISGSRVGDGERKDFEWNIRRGRDYYSGSRGDCASMVSLSCVVVSVGDDGERKGISGSESLAGRVDEVGETSRTGWYGRRMRDTETLSRLICFRGKFYRLGVSV